MGCALHAFVPCSSTLPGPTRRTRQSKSYEGAIGHPSLCMAFHLYVQFASPCQRQRSRAKKDGNRCLSTDPSTHSSPSPPAHKQRWHYRPRPPPFRRLRPPASRSSNDNRTDSPCHRHRCPLGNETKCPWYRIPPPRPCRGWRRRSRCAIEPRPAVSSEFLFWRVGSCRDGPGSLRAVPIVRMSLWGQRFRRRSRWNPPCRTFGDPHC
mmetsp:Transcript_36986/g.78105  ORF Transcript_36986/g.78105 Transcript_36986/m.78105 type:complete len:208 (-) Transcript_36986:645-1268(-)